MVLAQQQSQPPPANVPYQTPPTFPEGRQTPGQPPDTHAPPPAGVSNQQIELQIVQRLRAEPTLSGTNVHARVHDSSVVLTGSVTNVTQHGLVVRIAKSKAGDRKIVDKIHLKHQT